jgi:hypothetical protein
MLLRNSMQIVLSYGWPHQQCAGVKCPAIGFVSYFSNPPFSPAAGDLQSASRTGQPVSDFI